MAEIERVMPIPGARVVDFDYDAADAALALVTVRMPTVVGEQVPERTTAAGNATDEWRGHFREEFDEAEGNLRTRFESIAGWGPVGPSGEIYAAAARANERQEEYNAQRQREIEAEEERQREREDENAPTG